MLMMFLSQPRKNSCLLWKGSRLILKLDPKIMMMRRPGGSLITPTPLRPTLARMATPGAGAPAQERQPPGTAVAPPTGPEDRPARMTTAV